MDTLPPPPPAIVVQQNPADIPEWPKDVIWYQVFPERFRNGTPENDPRAEDFGGTNIPGWRVSPWGMEWYARDDWEKPRKDEFFETVFDRRFGGDLVGLREQLPYLQKLGINAIYLNPIFHAASLHKYDATSYHHIDPTFGPDREGDLRAIAEANETEDPATWIWTKADLYFLELVSDVHARGMRIIIDGVFNHSGTRFFAFHDVKMNGKNSKYVDWYQIKTWREDGTFDYSSWDEGGSLPTFGRNRDTLNPGIKKYIFDITRRWMDPSGSGRPSEGIDGWRLDVAARLPHQFWREWHSHARSINAQAYTTGEIVTPARDWLNPEEFDAVMNYEWTYPTLSFFKPGPSSIGAKEFKRRIDLTHEGLTWDTILKLQNLLDSHDTGRVLTMFESPLCPDFTEFGPYFSWPKTADTSKVITSKPGKEAIRSLYLAVVWQMAGPGAPMIYYGTEVGMWGASDPCDRQPMLWGDIPAKPETLKLRGELSSVNIRAPDMETFHFYQRLISLRKAEAALRRGTHLWLESPNDSTLAFERTFEGSTIWCVINKGHKAVDIELPQPGYDLWTDHEITAGLISVAPSAFRLIRLNR